MVQEYPHKEIQGLTDKEGAMFGGKPLQEVGTVSAKTPWCELAWRSLAIARRLAGLSQGAVRDVATEAVTKGMKSNTASRVLPLLSPPPQDSVRAVRTGRRASPPPVAL